MDDIKVTIQLTRWELMEMTEEAINTTTPDPTHKKILMSLGLVEKVKGQGGRLFPTDKVETEEGFAKDEVMGLKL